MADFQSNINVNIDTSNALASIKLLQRQISQFHAQMAKGGAAAQASAQQLQQQLVNNINASKGFSAEITRIASTTESFTTALEKNKLSMGQYFRYGMASTRTFGKFFQSEFNTINKVARERVKDLQSQYIKLGRDANGSLQAIKVRPLTLDMQNLGTQTAIAAQKQQLFNQLLKQGTTNLLNFGKNTQWAGRQLMVGFTIPLSMLGVAAGRTFQKLEEQAIRFKRVYGELFTTQAETDSMLQSLKDLGEEFTKYGVSLEKTMSLAADAAAMGKMGADLLAQVEQATRLAVLGGVEQQEALETTISITNAFGVATEDLTNKINFLNAVENQTVVSIEDLTVAIPKAGPVVKQLGGDVEDLAFFLTAMKEGGINASEGANALKSGIARIINPTEKASEMLGGLGINIRGIVENNAGDIRTTLVTLASELDKLDPLNRARAIEELFGKFQFARISTLFQNIVGEGTQAARVLQLTQASAEELAVLSERELKRVEESPAYKFQKALEKLQISLAPIGEAFLKAVTPIVEFAAKILKRFDEMSDGGKQFLVTITTLGGVVAPVLLMVIGLVANGIANLMKFLGMMGRYFSGTAGASGMLGEQIDYLTQQQLEQLSVAASLDQVHNNLTQRFTAEAAAIGSLASAYGAVIAKQREYLASSAAAATGGAASTSPTAPGGKYNPFIPPVGLASGTPMIPGPKGAGDVVPAMLAPGEAVIPADKNAQYHELVKGIIAGNIPGFDPGTTSVAGVRFRSQSTANSVATLRETLGDNADLVDTALERFIVELEDGTREIRGSFKDISAAITREANEQGRWDTPGLSGTNTARSHFQMPLTGDARQSALASTGYGQLPPELLRNVDVLGNLVGALPQQANLLLDKNNLPADYFAKVMASKQDKLLDTARAGGMDETDENLAALRTLEAEIAEETISIAAARTEAGQEVLVGDQDLATATRNVIEKHKALGGAAEAAANALDQESQTVGKVRSSQGVAMRDALMAEGKLVPTGSGDELGYVLDDGTVVSGVARNSESTAAGSGVTPSGSYSKRPITTTAQADAEAYDQAVANALRGADPYPKSTEGSRSSPHPQAPIDGADDGRAYMEARQKAMQDPYAQSPLAPPTAPQTGGYTPSRREQLEAKFSDSKTGQWLGKKVSKLSGNAVTDSQGNVLYDPNQDPSTWAGKMEEQRLAEEALLAQKRQQIVEETQSGKQLNEAGIELKNSGQELKDSANQIENAARQDAGGGPGLNAKGKGKGKGSGLMRSGGNLAGGVFMLGSAAMAAQMVGGPIGEAAGAVAAPLMAIGGLLPMISKLPIVVQGLLVAAGVIAYAIYKVNDALNKVRKESLTLADAMGTGSRAMEKFAMFSGKATSTEIMDKKREAEQTPFAVQPGKKSTGEAFFETEDGQAMAENIRKSLQEVGEDETINDVYLQLGNAVATGALDMLEAQSIAQALAGEFDSTNLAIGVNGKLLDLVTGSGIDALTEPITVEARQQLVDDTFTDLDALLNMEPPSYDDTIFEAGQEELGNLGIDPVELVEEKGFFGGLMSAFGSKFGQLFTDPGEYFGGLWNSAKAVTGYTETAEAIALTAEQVIGLRDALKSTEAQIDAVTLEYQEKIDKARAEGNDEYADQLEAELADTLKPFLEAREKAFSLASTKISEDSVEFRKSLRESLALAFEGADLDTATQLFDDINTMTTLDSENKLMLQYQLSTGTFTLSQIQDIVNDFSDRPEVVEKIIAMGVKTPDAKEVMSIVQTVKDNPALQDGLVDVFSTDNMEEFEDSLELYRAARRVGSIVPFKADDPDVFVELAYSNPEAAAAIRTDLDALEAAAAAGPITNEFAIDLIGAEAFAAIAFMWDSLNEDGKKAALYAMTVSLGFEYTDPAMAGFVFGGGEQQVDPNNPDPTGTAAAIAERAVNSSIFSLFDNGEDFDPKGDGAGAQNSLEGLTKKLRDVRDETIKVAKTWEEATQTLSGLFAGGTKAINVFNGLENQLRALGASEDLIEMIAGMDPDEFEKRKNDLFDFDASGTKMTGLKAQLLDIGAALSAVALGDYVNDQQRFIENTKNQMTAMTKLTASGMSYTEAFKAVQDASFATAIATAATAEEIEEIVRITERMKEMQEEYNKISENDQALSAIKDKNKEYEKRARTLTLLSQRSGQYTDAQIDAIMSDSNLQQLFLNPSIGKGALEKALKQAEEQAKLDLEIKKLTVKGKQEIFDTAMGQAQEAFDAQQEKLQIEFDVKMSDQQDVVKEAEEAIALLQYEIDDYQAQLKEIEDQEDLINDRYEKRFEALDQIGEANERIARAQKSQLDIAEALSSGDIAAAARAAAQAQEEQSQDAIDLQRTALEDAQERELAALTGSAGITREDLEDLIKQREDQIFRIEEDQLEPAREAIRLEQLRLDAQVEALEVVGKTREEWEAINNQIRIANVESWQYVESLMNGLEIVDELIAALPSVKPEPKKAAPKASSGGGGGGGGGPELERKSEWTFGPDSPYPNQSVAQVAKDLGYAQWQDYYNENRGIDYQIIPKIKRAGGGMIIPKRMNMGGRVGYAMGGGVKGYAAGGYSMGTDIVPAMLTPGEFVVRRPAVSKYGVDMLKKINDGQYSEGSVYNYNLELNVKSNSNPDQIARTVMREIKRVDSQRIRGNKF